MQRPPSGSGTKSQRQPDPAPTDRHSADGDVIYTRLQQIDPSFKAAHRNRFFQQIQRGADAVDDLIAELESSSADHRCDAVEALGEIGKTRALAPLRHLLKDPVSEVRIGAAIALIKIGDQVLMPEIVKALRNEDPQVVVGAAVALGKLADRRVVPNLVEAFKTDNPVVGSAVAWALGQCGDPAALPWLSAAIENNFASANACEALGRIGDARGAGVLLRALKAEDEDTRAYAARALGMLRLSVATGTLGARMGNLASTKVVQNLKRALKDRTRKVRLCAAIALYELGDKSGGKHLVRELNG